MDEIKIRWAHRDEWAPAMTMIWKTFMKFDAKDYTGEGVKNFFDFITDDRIYQSFLQGTYQLLVAVDGAKVVGAASIRNHNHLSLLFVDEEYHRRGIGKALLLGLSDYLSKEMGERYMSVKAAPYALGFYKKVGFNIVGPEEDYAGIRVTAMEKYFDSRAKKG